MSIIFVNGILNGTLDANESAVDISRSIGNRKVEYVFNDTYSVNKTVNDLVQKILEEADTCRNALKLVAQRANEICILLIAHSHGASILELTLKDSRINNSLKACIRIITIGGAALIPTPSHKSVENLINEYDFIPLFAHKEFRVENLPKDLDGITRFFFEFIAGCKKIIQESVLKISSHEKPALTNRIQSAMRHSWGSTPVDTSLQRSINALQDDIIQTSQKHLNSSTPTTEEWKNFFVDTLSVGIAHTFYNVEILKIDQPSASNYFDAFHSVKSYLPKVSELALKIYRRT